MYAGEYNGSTKHEPDLRAVVSRALAAGVTRMMITAGSLQDAREALAMADELDPHARAPGSWTHSPTLADGPPHNACHAVVVAVLEWRREHGYRTTQYMCDPRYTTPTVE